MSTFSCYDVGMATRTIVKSAGIYCRISKSTDGTTIGVDRQEALCRELAADKDWSVGAVYVDNDLSAYRGKSRPQYEAMIKDLEAGTLDAVLVVDQDRLTRHPRELEDFIRLADRLGTPLANVQGDIDLSTSDGRFRARIMGAVARQESEKKSDRHKRQLEALASKGGAPGGKRRYGYERARLDDGTPTFEVVPEEAEVVREIAQRALQGEALNAIAKDLNSRQVPTATGKQWRVQTLTALLGSPHIAGLRVHQVEEAKKKGRDPIVGDGNWEPIIDRVTHAELKRYVVKPKDGRKKGRPATHLLTGFVKCGRCQGPMYHGTRKVGERRYEIYKCNKLAGTENCGTLSVVAEPVEELVTDYVLGRMGTKYVKPTVHRDEEQIANLLSAVETRKQKLQRFIELHVEDKITEAEWLTARKTIETQIAELEAQLAETDPVSEEWAYEDYDPSKWVEAELADKRKTLTRLVDSVIIHPSNGTREFDPGRVEVVPSSLEALLGDR